MTDKERSVRYMVDFKFSKTLDRLPEQFFAKLVGKVQALKAAGHDVINLGQGNPDLPTPPEVVEALKEAAENAAKKNLFNSRQKPTKRILTYYFRLL